MLGNFENGNPYINIEVSGISGERKKIKALVDTGFNGSLSLPYIIAFPLGLVLKGIESSTLADGSLSHCFVCSGNVKMDDKEVKSAISIKPSCPILIGTQLLKALGKKMDIDFVNEKMELSDAPILNSIKN